MVIVFRTTRSTGIFGRVGRRLPGRPRLPGLPEIPSGLHGRFTRDNPLSRRVVEEPGGRASMIPERSRPRSAAPECMMVINRHSLLLAGLLLFLLGVQFRLVTSFTLNERSSHFVAARLGAGEQPMAWQAPPLRKVVEPPRWLGLALMSVGAVLTVKGIALRTG
jgi:hypothetical protein